MYLGLFDHYLIMVNFIVDSQIQLHNCVFWYFICAPSYLVTTMFWNLPPKMKMSGFDTNKLPVLAQNSHCALWGRVKDGGKCSSALKYASDFFVFF